MNIETCFIAEVSNNNQWKESAHFCKTVLGFFWNSSALKRSVTFYMWAAAT